MEKELEKKAEAAVAGASRGGPVAPALAGGGLAGYVPTLSFPICNIAISCTRSQKRMLTTIALVNLF